MKRVPLPALEKFIPSSGWRSPQFHHRRAALHGLSLQGSHQSHVSASSSFIALAVYLMLEIRNEVRQRPTIAATPLAARTEFAAFRSSPGWARSRQGVCSPTLTWLRVGIPGGFEEAACGPNLRCRARERWIAPIGPSFVADHLGCGHVETLHYLGLSLLLGTVGLFDLRVLGMAKAIPPSALHKLIPIGIAGYCVNILTGITFFSGFPSNTPTTRPSSGGVFMAIAAMNVPLFYLSTRFARSDDAAGADAPLPRESDSRNLAWRLGRGVDLRRLLTFYRPLFPLTGSDGWAPTRPSLRVPRAPIEASRVIS
jgi:hypothetical protein